MRRAERLGPPPQALAARDRKGQTELDRARAWYARVSPPKKAFPFEAYRDEDVRQRLTALFHGKCAYCESTYRSTAPMDVEHYRPKGRPEGDLAHPGYWWLAADWDNLLPSCIHCNRRSFQQVVAIASSLAALSQGQDVGVHVMLCGKQNAFPVKNARAAVDVVDLAGEEALLLDPCRDDPDSHLVFTTGQAGPISLVIPRLVEEGEGAPAPCPRGAMSIQVYGLNRLGLVQERTRLLRRLEFLSDLVCGLDEVVRTITAADPDVAAAVGPRLELLIDRILAEMQAMAAPTEPYSAMVRHWLASFAAGPAGTPVDPHAAGAVPSSGPEGGEAV